MCRIAGIIDKNENDLTGKIALMRDAMRRGGPDDEGVLIDKEKGLAFGHRRLSIIELSSLGHQPMSILNGDIQIIFNGEIYNYQQIKNELINLGVAFKSGSDTEVILQAYHRFGADCFKRFNGIFALAILDRVQNKIILARDHAGIKPLYYYLSDNVLYFASEIRAFKALNKFEENPDWRIYFLLFGHLPEPVTTLNDVQPLPKGSYLQYALDSGKVVIAEYNTFHFTSEIKTAKEAETRLRKTLAEAVERNLVSDAPIGLFLSGGIDSSLLTLLAQPIQKSDLHTLSIVFNEEEFSEKKYQEIITRQTGAKHKSYLVTEKEFKEFLPDILEAMDQPTVDGINSYFISKYAHEYGLKAVLSGIGSDELFGGYPSFANASKFSQASKLPAFALKFFQNVSSDRWKKIAYASKKDIIGEYLFFRGLFTPAQAAHILDMNEQEVWMKLNRISSPYLNGLGTGNRVSYAESNFYMQNQLLKDADFMSMWHALEVRVPFLDKEVIDLAYKIDENVKFGNGGGKVLLINAFKDILPEEIWNRPKRGFTFPFVKWMKNSEIAAPTNDKLNKLFNQFSKGKLSWSRYWTSLLADTFN